MAWLARGALLRPAQPGALRRQGAGRPRAAGRGRLRRAHDRLRRCSTSTALLTLAVAVLLAAGLQVTPGRLPVAPLLAVAGLLLAGGGRPAGRAATAPSPPIGRPSRCSTSSRRRSRGASRCRIDALAADVYWIRALQHFGGTRKATGQAQELRAALSAARHGDGARPALQHRLPLRRDLPRPSRSRAGRAGPIWPSSCCRRASRPRPRSGSTCRTSASSISGRCSDYKGAAAWFERGSKVPGAAWFLKPLAATTLAQGGQRSASRTLFQAIAESRRERLDAQGRPAAPAAARRDGRDGPAPRRSSGIYRERGGPTPVTWEALVRAGYLRAIPTDPDGFGVLARTVERRRRPRRGLDARAAARRAAVAPPPVPAS